ncbi:MAG: OFA family MFS transporter [Candidatus Marinimicrobia bacterium]|nr:OFA family MFS transporter [Candidatus Neomarinimicrobiota bacterium]
MSKQKTMNRNWVILGAILIQLCLGAIYAWSVFTPSLVKAGWSNLQTQIVFSTGLAVFAIVMVFAGKKLASWGPQKLAFLAGVTLGAGYLLTGLAGGTHFWLKLIFVGIIGGAGIGLGYVVPISVGMRWFPDKKGMITGLAVAGFGFGAMGWVKLAGTWGNLLNKYGLAATFIIYGVLFAGLTIIGSFFMKYPPEGWFPEGYQPYKPAGPKEQKSAVNFKPKEMMKTMPFYLVFLIFTFTAGAGLMSIGLMKLYPMEALQTAGKSVEEASAIAGTAMAVFFSLANGIGRVIWGTMSDKLGRKYSVLIMALSQGIMMLVFTKMAGSQVPLYIGAAIIGFNFGGNFALFPAFTADLFGDRNIGLNYPYIYLSYGVGGILGPVLGGMLGDLGNFNLAFTLCGVLCLLGAGLTMMIRHPEK